MADSLRLGEFYAAPGSVEFMRFDACDARDGAVPAEFDLQRFEQEFGYAPSGPEMGCAVSHFRCLLEFAASDCDGDELMVVAEDDARLGEDFIPVLRRVIARVHGAEWVLLGNPYDEAGKRHVHSRSHSFELSLASSPVGVGVKQWKYRKGPFEGTPWGAGLYLVSHAAARKFVSEVSEGGRVFWIADDYAFFTRRSSIVFTAVLPNLCGWSGDSGLREASAASAQAGAISEYRSRRGLVAWMRRTALRSRIRHLRVACTATGRHLRGALERRRGR